MDVPVDQIYVIVHPEQEAERLKYLQTFLSKVIPSKVTWFTPFWKGIDDFTPVKNNLGQVRENLSEAAGHLYLSYIKLFQQIAASEHETVLILESDVLAPENWMEQLQQVVQEWKSLPNFVQSTVFLGNGCNLQPDARHIRKTEHLFLANSSKCADSMLFTKQTIQALLVGILPITAPIDWYLNYFFWQQKYPAYWMEPHIFVQGSQNGTYCSEVVSNKFINK